MIRKLPLAFDPRVAIGKLSFPTYEADKGQPCQQTSTLDQVCELLGWKDESRGPFGRIIEPGDRVVIKPNFVLHKNKGPWGIDPLVTHASLVREAVSAALRAGAGNVLVGDAPIQGCDLEALLSTTGLKQWADETSRRDSRFGGIRDFRRTTCVMVDDVRIASENLVPEQRFVLFDLKRDSVLEPITDDRNPFRVTCYDPNLLAKTHGPGRHQYLVAREVMEADVVINIPKLKTHCKAGITCALKNLVGINGNKEYLPHHRIGGSKSGGDCYPGRSLVKRGLEYLLDKQNSSKTYTTAKWIERFSVPLNLLLRIVNDRTGVEGAWSGNDTVWRTCLDLNRILMYGRADQTLSSSVQRRVIHIVDAIIAGHGEGPLSPQPLPMGLMLAGSNAAAIDFVAAQLLAYDPTKIPLVSNAFGIEKWPIAPPSFEHVALLGDLGTGAACQVLQQNHFGQAVLHPVGWRDCRASHTPISDSATHFVYSEG